MRYLCNAFTISMIPAEARARGCAVEIVPIGDPRGPLGVPRDVVSYLGHNTDLVSALLGFAVPTNRESLQLGANDTLYVAQYTGPRLPEGATSLPEGATIEWFMVSWRPFYVPEGGSLPVPW